ncbi:anti-sigma-28 factor, FlgM [Kyrpidia tusciae DSM 2912]|uniref:Negative regulator of flagellin synthesis n=2 Tax=Kyrpidia TaxID=1129704 RepID=D5WVS4_KYRT2|nr:anti-sigma-28 factor, FlgM [Kyrpidia tusciae DSM 2912]
MRIDGNSPGWQQVYETWRNRRPPEGAGERGPASGGGDEVAISEAARALAGAPQVDAAADPRTVRDGAGAADGALQAAPTGESREERIARLKEEIASGTYQVDPGRLADRMLDWVTAARRVNRDRGEGPGFSHLSGQTPGLAAGLLLGSGDVPQAGRSAGGVPADPTMPAGDSPPKAGPGAGPGAADREGGGAR